MQFSKSFVGVIAAGIALAACNSVDFKKTRGGMPYKLYASEKGDSVKPGSIIKINLKQWLDDSVIYPVKDQPAMPVYFQVSGESQPYDVSELFQIMKEGDSVYAVQAIDTFLARAAKNPQQQPIPPQFKKGGKFITALKVVKIFNSPQEAQADEAKERATAFLNDTKIQQQLSNDEKAIKDYLAQNNITAEKKGSGTYVQTLSAGNGPATADGKYVSLMYKGQTFSGKVFDTNMDNSFQHTDPLSFVLGQTPMIKGFEEGITGLTKGSKVRLYIPSALAYGANPNPQSGIKPNENLIFDIEVLEVADNPPSANMPPSPSNDTTGR